LDKARGKTCSAILIASLIFALSLVTPIRPAKAQEPFVKVYVYQPLGYIPFVAPGSPVTIDIMIETSGISDGTDGGIVGWGLNVQVDPNVLDINLTAPPPPPFPPPPPPAKIIGKEAGYFLYEYGLLYGITPTLMAGSSDPTTGYWNDIAETFIPNPLHGAGNYTSGLYPNLVTLEVTSKSDTQPCLIDLVSGFYKTGEAAPFNVYPVDILVDGYYGPQPPHAEFTYTPSMPLVGDPVTFNASASYDPDGNITSYEWDFGDETPSGAGNITTHTYGEAGMYTVTLNVTDNDGSWGTASKNVTIYGPPVASFTYSPSSPSLGETVTFNASESYDLDGGNETYPSGIVSYDWDFGDETTGTETNPIITHKYFEAGTFIVTLNVTDDEGLTSNTTATVTVSGAAAAAELDVEVDVGSIHFIGEIAEFYVLTSFMGEPVNATQINARLYYGGALHGDLSGSVENIATGLYRVPYTIPIDASVGTYVLVVNASFFTQKGVSLKSFLLSPTLTDQNALIIDIEGDIATILTDVGAIKADLTTINATLVGMEGTIAIIHSTIGEFTAPGDTICATLTEIKGDVATIESTLGSIEDDIDDINGEISDIDGTLVTIQTDIGEIQTDVTAINAKLTAINETVGIVKTDLMGLVEVELDKINATIADVQDGLVTVNSTLGDIQLDLGDVTLELISVQGDIKEGVTNITAAITDAEGNILVELGHVEVTLEDINATLEIIDGSLVTIRTDIGTIEGTITSIRGDIATIETDIGTIEAILEEWTGVTTSSITTPVGTFDIMVLTNSTLEGSVTFSDNALTMIVSGQTGTTGILNVKIPRQLLIGIESNIEDLVVTINGRRVSFTYTEEAELYTVRATYTHSTHTIMIYLSESQTPDVLTLWILLVVAFTIAISAIVATPYVLATRRRRIKQ